VFFWSCTSRNESKSENDSLTVDSDNNAATDEDIVIESITAAGDTVSLTATGSITDDAAGDTPDITAVDVSGAVTEDTNSGKVVQTLTTMAPITNCETPDARAIQTALSRKRSLPLTMM